MEGISKLIGILAAVYAFVWIFSTFFQVQFLEPQGVDTQRGSKGMIPEYFEPQAPIKEPSPSLIQQDLYAPQGTPFPLEHEVVAMSRNIVTSGPTIDGSAENDRSMFVFKRNEAKPECCPSQFSTSTGCVCLNNAKQNEFLSSRGHNAKFFDWI